VRLVLTHNSSGALSCVPEGYSTIARRFAENAGAIIAYGDMCSSMAVLSPAKFIQQLVERSLAEAVRLPAFVDEFRAGEVLENCFEVVP
jgi:hypothetical protein